jgi:transposase-like protein
MVLKEHLPVNEVAKRLNVSENQIHAWKQTFKESGPVAFPGKRKVPSTALTVPYTKHNS